MSLKKVFTEEGNYFDYARVIIRLGGLILGHHIMLLQ
jgi:hypothetical protein